MAALCLIGIAAVVAAVPLGRHPGPGADSLSRT
jgi:hypothetical protein